MIKYIKRAGICFFAIAIICLMVVGCLLSSLRVSDNISKLDSTENETNQSNVNTNNSVTGKANLPAGLTYRIGLDCECAVGTPCTCGKMAEKWKEAITYSANHNENVNVILEKDWLAHDDANKGTSFGDDIGLGYCDAFYNGRPAVTSDATISLDLNGHTIDRRLKTRDEEGNLTGEKARVQGNVILVYEGRLNLYDSSYDAEEVATIYEQYKDDEEGLYNALKNLNYGKITGGACSSGSSGGGVNVNHSGASFYMYGGIITENWSSEVGGVSFEGSTTGSISGGLIFDNSSSIYSAVSLRNSYKVFINGGTLIAFNNTNAVNDFGGGVGVIGTGSCNISDVTIAYNYSKHNGGGISMQSNDCVTINNVVIAHNVASAYGAGIRIMDRSNVRLAGTNDIYDNFHLDNVPSDIYFVGVNSYLTISDKLALKENGSGKKMFVTYYALEYNYFNPFTNGFTRYNKGIDPASLFASSEGRVVLKNGEVFIDKSADSKYDYMYIDNNDGTRKYYNDNEILHDYNDKDIETLVLGKILPYTSINEFITNIQPFGFSQLKIYNCNATQIYGEGADSKFATLYDNGLELAIGTGFKIEHLKANGELEIIYLSVLGDLTGDGKVNSADVNMLRQVVANADNFSSIENKPYLQLAMLIGNVNGLSINDTEILWNIVSGKANVENYL